MDINIVWNIAKPGIITRLATALQKETGWTISHRPRDDADLNYFMLYIMIGQTLYTKTKTAAWFTHYELTRPNKQQWWKDAAERVDLRLTTARQYLSMLQEYGQTALVEYPPIDEQFISKPVIGLSGYVHPGGRKGEKLVKWLVDSGKFDDCKFIASGKGWPIENVYEYKWHTMTAFYHELDVFLCTSSVEGLPMPPLEALAMGKPIVIPKGVGLLDDLPTLPGSIHWYDRESNDSLLRALRSALVPIQARKAIVGMYTAKEWAKQHKDAIEEFLGLSQKVDSITIDGQELSGKVSVMLDTVPIETVSEIANEVDSMFPDVFVPLEGWSITKDGPPIIKVSYENSPSADELKQAIHESELQKANEVVAAWSIGYTTIPHAIENACAVFIAYGEPARECVQVAINSWHKHMSEPCILISDSPLGIEDIFIEHSDDDIGARSIKTRLLEIVPDEWQYILYLDADTEIVANVQFLFQLLVDGWDIVACMNPAQYTTLESGLRPDNKPDLELTYEVTNGLGNYLQPNGGVMGIHRNDATRKIFKQWHQEWQVFAARDQMALFRALWKCDVKLYLLGQEWNTITRYNDASMSAGILHHPMRARRWRGMIDGRLDSGEAWAQVYPKDDNDDRQ